MGDGKLFLHAGTGHGRQLGKGGLVRDTLVMGWGGTIKPWTQV